MGTVFFDGVLGYIGKYVRYEALANYAGNSFFKDSPKIIEENFPLRSEKQNDSHAISSLLKGIKITRGNDGESAMPDWAQQAKARRKAERAKEGAKEA